MASFIDWTKIVDDLLLSKEVIVETCRDSFHVDKREITHIGDKEYPHGIPIPNLGYDIRGEYIEIEKLLLEKWSTHFPKVSIPMLTPEGIIEKKHRLDFYWNNVCPKV